MTTATLIACVLGACAILEGLAALHYFREAHRNRPKRRETLVARAQQLGHKGELLTIPEDALAVLVETPPLWEYRLLQLLLTDHLDRLRRKRLDFRFSAPLPEGQTLDLSATNDWVQARFTAVRRMIATLTHLIDEAIPEALGPPGVSGDPYRIFHAASALSDLYDQALNWGFSFHRVAVPPVYGRLFELLPKSAESLLEAIEELKDKLWIFIEHFDFSPPGEGEKRVVNLTITLRDAIPPEVHEEIEKIGRAAW